MRRLFEYFAASALYLTLVGLAVRFGFQSIRGGFEELAVFVFSGIGAGFMAYYLLDRFGDGILTKERG